MHSVQSKQGCCGKDWENVRDARTDAWYGEVCSCCGAEKKAKMNMRTARPAGLPPHLPPKVQALPALTDTKASVEAPLLCRGRKDSAG